MIAKFDMDATSPDTARPGLWRFDSRLQGPDHPVVCDA